MPAASDPDFTGRVKRIFEKNNDENVSVAIVAIKTLLELIKTEPASTIFELNDQMKEAIKVLRFQSEKMSETSITSGSELFLKFISNIKDERRDDDFDECRKLILERGKRFVKKVESSRQKIAKLGSPHIREKSTILVHSYSRVVLELLFAASVKQFKVYVTESAPDYTGRKMVDELRKRNITAECIMDAAAAYYMERVDLVLVGAEGILASGGIINKIGTLSIAMVAKTCNKPFYVAAESFKFSDLYPLSQSDLTKFSSASSDDVPRPPKTDYTMPEFITLLFTDIGILTPTAVSDELIKLT